MDSVGCGIVDVGVLMKLRAAAGGQAGRPGGTAPFKKSGVCLI
jgi:hypothetical protein